MTVKAAGLCLGYSKNRIVDQTIKLLLQLANESCLRERIDAMFADSTVTLTSVHLKSSPHDDPGQHRGCALHRRVAPRREEDTVISGP